MWKLLLVLLTVCVFAFCAQAAAEEPETVPDETEETVTEDEQAAADLHISYDYDADLYIYGYARNADAGKKLIVSIEKEDGAVLYLYEDKTFDLVLADGAKLAGTFAFEGTELAFTQEDGAQVKSEKDENGDSVFTFTMADGTEAAFILEKDVVAYVYEACMTLSAQNQ